MIIRPFSLCLLCLVFLLTSVSHAQTTPSIAVLVSFEAPASADLLDGFRSYLQQQGVSVDLVIHTFENSQERADAIIAQLRETKPTLVLALGGQALNNAGEQLTEIPVIASMVVQRSGFNKYENVTGVALEFPLEDQIAWMHKILPSINNVGVIYNSEENHLRMGTASKMLKREGLTLHPKQISEPTELMLALKQLRPSIDSLWAVNDAMVLNSKTAQSILLFSLRNKIPFVGLSRAWVKAGALYALERDYFDIGQQCAQMAMQSLAGKDVDKIGVKTPRTIRYSINLKIANRMKIELSKGVISKAEAKF